MKIKKSAGGIVGFVVFGLLVLAMLFAETGVISTTQAAAKISKPVPLKVQKNRIKNLNTQLKRTGQQYIRTKSDRRKKRVFASIKKIVNKRAGYLSKLLEKDPESANQLALSGQERSLLPAGVEGLIEKNIELEGTLVSLIEEDFEAPKAVFKFFLRADDGKRYELRLLPASKPLLSGQRVKVKGISFGQGIAALPESAGGIEVLEEEPFYAAINNLSTLTESATASNIKKAVVILFNFQNDTSHPWTKEYVRDIVFNQANNYYLENSYNKLGLTGDVFGYYTLPIDKACDSNSLYNSVKPEVIRASDPDIYFPNYDTIIFMGPLAGCGWSGSAWVGSTENSTGDGYITAGNVWISNSPSFPTSFVVSHELGHSYGLWHANFYNCGAESLKQSGCSSVEYGDNFDVMDRNLVHMNGYHKEQLGFFNPGNVLQVASSGSYTISPIETASAGPQVLKIARGNGTFLYIEYRQPLGVDSKFSFYTGVLDGALIHIAPLYIGAGDSELLDMTPTSPESSNNSILGLGKSFTDPGVATITVTNQTPASLTLNITFPSKTPPTVNVKANDSDGSLNIVAPASYSIGWSSAGQGTINCSKSGDWSGSGQGAGTEQFNDVLTAGTYTYTVTCSDGSGLSASDTALVNVVNPAKPPVVNFNINGQTGRNLTLYFETSPIIYLEWNAQYATLGCTNSGDWDGSAYSHYSNEFRGLATGTYNYVVTCSNPLGAVIKTIKVNIKAGVPDTTPPTVSITSPPNGSNVSGAIAVSIGSGDNIGVSYVEFYVDGQLTNTDYDLPYEFSWDTKSAVDGSHFLAAKAYDADGNSALSSPVSVTVANTLASLCTRLSNTYGEIIMKYDGNKNQTIERTEAAQAVADFFNNLITREQAVAVTQFYFGGCILPLSPSPSPSPVPVVSPFPATSPGTSPLPSPSPAVTPASTPTPIPTSTPTPNPTPSTSTCAELLITYRGTITKYDLNGDKQISKTEATAAVTDFFSGLISRDEAVAVTNFYMQNCALVN